MLVAIVVILILAAIIIPVAGRMQAAARNAQGVSNLKNLATYVNLLEQQDPTGFTAWDYLPGSHEVNWKGRLIASGLDEPNTLAKVTFSPAWNPNSALTSDGGIEPWFGFGLDTGSYVYETDPSTGRTLFRLPSELFLVERPSSRILFVDSINRRVGGTGERKDRWQAVTVSISGSANENLNAEGVVHLRNNGRANVLFMDGRVEALTPQGIRDSLRRAGISSGPFVYWDQDLVEHTQN